MATIPDDVKPILLTVMDFSVDDSYFLWQSIVDDALRGPVPHLMDDFRFYNAKQFKPHIYFDSWQTVMDPLPPAAVVRCSAMSPDGENVRRRTQPTTPRSQATQTSRASITPSEPTGGFTSGF